MSIGAGDGIGPTEVETVDTMSEIYALIQGADRAVDQQRFELAQSLAAIAQARALADIANALRDDDGNNVAHILHNMSYALATIAESLAVLAQTAQMQQAIMAEGGIPDAARGPHY